MARPDDLLREDGENMAVRGFLMMYGGANGITVGMMRDHMALLGWGKCWPAWVNEAHANMHLTKAGAQDWVRHLFALEQAHFVPWTPEMMDRYLTQAASPEGIPTISNFNYLDAAALPSVPDASRDFAELLARIPRTMEQLEAFLDTHFEVSETKGPDRSHWRYLLTLHDLHSAFDAAGLYEWDH